MQAHVGHGRPSFRIRSASPSLTINLRVCLRRIIMMILTSPTIVINGLPSPADLPQRVRPLCLAKSFVKCVSMRGDLIPGKAPICLATRCFSHRPNEVIVISQFTQFLTKRSNISGFYYESCPAIINDLGNSSDIGNHNGSSAVHRLKYNEPQKFGSVMPSRLPIEFDARQDQSS